MGDFGIAGLWLLLAMSLVAAVLVAAGSMLLADRTLHQPVSEGHNGALSPFLTCVGLVYGALLGFTIVVAWEQFSSAETNVSNEASTLDHDVPADRRHARPGADPDAGTAAQIHEAVEGPEWENAIRAGSGTESARDALNEMYRVLGSEQSSVAIEPDKSEVSRPADHVGVAAQSANPGRQTANTRACCGPGCFSAVSSCWGSAVSCAWGAHVRI